MLRRSVVRHNAMLSSIGLGTASLGQSIGAFGLAFVPTGHTGVVETFGNYSHSVSPGLNFYVPFIQRVRSVSNMTQQASYEIEAKTRDNIFVTMSVSAQFLITPDQSADALYKMATPMAQIHSFLDSELRAQVSKRDLDQLFTEQEEVSHSIFADRAGKESVSRKIEKLGFTLLEVLIRHIDPAKKVKEAMNEINASLRLRDAAKNDADAKYIMAVREAEGDRDRKRLQGEGISQQRLAILRGYEDGISAISTKFGLTPQGVIEFVSMTQHLDTLEVIGKSNNCKTLFLSHDPASFRRAAHSSVGAEPSGTTSREDLLIALEASLGDLRRELDRASSPPPSTASAEDTTKKSSDNSQKSTPNNNNNKNY